MAKGFARATATPYYRQKATCDEYVAFHYLEKDPLPDFLGPYNGEEIGMTDYVITDPTQLRDTMAAW